MNTLNFPLNTIVGVNAVKDIKFVVDHKQRCLLESFLVYTQPCDLSSKYISPYPPHP